jgi:coenzyme F420-0:L-glutamate ligase/coenzyme F420-1:gamma-L-glutamate ligase
MPSNEAKPDVPAELSLVALSGVPLVREGDDLVAIIARALAGSGQSLRDGDVLVIAQKIVSKAEGRSVALASVTPSARAVTLARETGKDARLVELMLSESSEVLRHRPGVIVVVHRLGMVLANAGIDSSNVERDAGEPRVLLLPRDPDRSCAEIRRRLREDPGVDIGVVINDSLGRAWRNGTAGTALGVSGVPALVDLSGRRDLFGRELQVTEVAVADELAAAASLLMGQADEGRPVVLARGVPYALREADSRELIRAKETDLFR